MLERVLNMITRVPHAHSPSGADATALEDAQHARELLAWAAALSDVAVRAEAHATSAAPSRDLEARRWALLSEAARRSYGYLPSDDQISAARAMALGRRAPVAAAEDCALIAGLTAADACLQGFVAHILESRADRARCATGALAPMFSLLGIPLLGQDSAPPPRTGAVGVALVCTPEHVVRKLAGPWWEAAEGWPELGGRAIALVLDPAVLAQPTLGARLRVGVRDAAALDVVERAGFVADHLKEGRDFRVDRRLGVATLSESGIGAVERRMNLDRPADTRFAQFVHQLGQAMLANAAYRRGRDYEVVGDDLAPIDPATRRPLLGRRFRHGLHEALQRKEALTIRGVSPVAASLTPAALLGGYTRVGSVACGARASSAREPAEAVRHGRELSAWSHTGDPGKYLSMSVEIEAAAAERRPVLGVFRTASGAEQVAALLKERAVDSELLDEAHDGGAAVVRATKFEAPPILWVCPAQARLARAPCSPPPALLERFDDLMIVAETLGDAGAEVLGPLSAPLGRVASYRKHVVPADEASGEIGTGSGPDGHLRLDAAVADIQARHFRSCANLRRDAASSADPLEFALALATPELRRLVDAFLPEDNAERWDRAGLVRMLGQYVPRPSLPELRPLRRLRPAERLEDVRGQLRASWHRALSADAAGDRTAQVRSLLCSIVESAAERLQGSLDDLAQAAVRLGPGWLPVGATSPDGWWREAAAAYELEAATLEQGARLAIGQELLVSLSQFLAEVEQPEPRAATIRREGPKVGRNEPCPCGSGKKYKRCCGAPSGPSTGAR